MRNEEIGEAFWDRIIDLLKKQGKNQRRLAEETGIDEKSIASSKRSQSLPVADNAVSIAKALNTTVEFLVTGADDYTEGADPELDDALRYIRTSRPASRLAKVMPLLTLAQYEALESVLKSWGLEEKE